MRSDKYIIPIILLYYVKGKSKRNHVESMTYEHVCKFRYVRILLGANGPMFWGFGWRACSGDRSHLGDRTVSTRCVSGARTTHPSVHTWLANSVARIVGQRSHRLSITSSVQCSHHQPWRRAAWVSLNISSLSSTWSLR